MLPCWLLARISGLQFGLELYVVGNGGGCDCKAGESRLVFWLTDFRLVCTIPSQERYEAVNG